MSSSTLSFGEIVMMVNETRTKPQLLFLVYFYCGLWNALSNQVLPVKKMAQVINIMQLLKMDEE